MISYANDLALKHARDFRATVKAPWYGSAFPKMRIGRDTEDGVYTSLKGFRQATSIGGSLTGMGGDTFIIDDPLKPLDAQSEPARNRVNEWIFNTLMSRLDGDPEDVVPTFFAERCARYLETSPPGDWQGFEKLTSK